MAGHHTYYGFERRWDSSSGGGPADSLDRLERALRRAQGSAEQAREQAREHDGPNPLVILSVRCCCGWATQLAKSAARSTTAVTQLLEATLDHTEDRPPDLLAMISSPVEVGRDLHDPAAHEDDCPRAGEDSLGTACTCPPESER